MFYIENDFIVIIASKMALISVFIAHVCLYSLIKTKNIPKKIYLFIYLFIKVIEIISFKYEFLYMYPILFFVGVLFNMVLILKKKVYVKEMIVSILVLFSTIPLLIILVLLYSLVLKGIYS